MFVIKRLAHMISHTAHMTSIRRHRRTLIDLPVLYWLSCTAERSHRRRRKNIWSQKPQKYMVQTCRAFNVRFSSVNRVVVFKA